MPVLSPAQRKSFTITKETAVWLASRLANGEKLRFQSTANRNWVAKIARTRYGVDTKVFASKDQLFDPARTVEGKDLEEGHPHYMTLYVAQLDMEATSNRSLPFLKPEYRTYVPTSYNRREDYVR